MKIDKCLYVFAVLGAVSCPTPARAQVTWAPYELEMAGDKKEAAEIGRFTVAERRGAANGRSIELAFVRLKSSAAKPAPPLVYLDGGPGGAGYTAASIPDYTEFFHAVRLTRDVILPSQRGVGLSSPRLACPSEGPLPDDFFVSATTMTQALEPRAKRCAATLREKGIDLSAYNTQESADDIEDLRRALGVEKVAIFGFSYGTHLGLEVLRRHPHSIDRAILAGTEGPWQTWKLPSGQDEQFGRLARAAGGDLVRIWKALLGKASVEPLRVNVRVGQTDRTLLIGPGGLQYLLRRDLGDTNDWPFIPAAIVQAAGGDATLVGRLAARRFAGFSGGMGLMGFAMDCGSGAPEDRLAQIKREIPGSLLGEMTNFPFPDVCRSLDLPMLPRAFRTPFASAVPTLFISGTNDGNTQPSQAEEVKARFSRAAHIVVEHAGHESTFILPVRDAALAFLTGQDVASQRISGSPVKFLPLDYKPR